MESEEPASTSVKRKSSLQPIFKARKKTKFSKPDKHQPQYMDGPISRLQAMLPKLEKMLLQNESPSDRTERVNGEFLLKYWEYLNDFKAFTHPNDPVLYSGDDGMVSCKICYFYVISHTISKQGDRFYVNHTSPCSYPLTGRGFQIYGTGSKRKEFFQAHRTNEQLSTSEYRWACGFDYDQIN